METPIVQAFFLCDQVITDEVTKKKSVIGITNRVAGRSFPLSLRSLAVFVSLVNGNGEMTCELRCTAPDAGETERILFGVKGPVHFPNPNAQADLVFALPNLTLPQPGVYCFMLFCEDELLSERRLFAKQLPPRTPPALPQ